MTFKTKKIISIILSVIMIIAVAGCTGGTEQSQPVNNNTQDNADSSDSAGENSGENTSASSSAGSSVNASDIPGVDFDAPPIQLTVFSQTANYSGKLTGWFAEVMLREFNVEMTIIPDNGIFDTRMESGNLGDIIIFGGEPGQYQRAVVEGKLFDWNEDDILSEFGPYIETHMPYAIEHNADVNESYSGRRVVHGFGHDVATSSEDHDQFYYTWDLRWDLYKELGYPEVNNLDDLFDLLVAMKEINPKDFNGNDAYAVSLWSDWDGNMVMYVKAFAAAYWGYDELGFGLYDVDSGSYSFALEPEGPYHECLKFFNRLFQAGLLDPNSMTQGFDDAGQKVLAGGSMMSIFNFMGRDVFNTAENKDAGMYMYTVLPEEATPLAYAMNVKGGERVWAIGANTEYPELCMAILNWLTTPDGCMTYFHGPKDLCWYYDDEGNSQYTELGESAKVDRRGTIMPDEWGGGDFNSGFFQANNTTWSMDASNPESNGETYNSEFWLSRRTGATSEIQQDWMDTMGFYDTDEFFRSRPYKISLSPASGYLEARKEGDLRVVWEQVANCIVDYSWRAIYAASDEEFDSIFNDMVKKCAEYDPNGIVLEWCREQAQIRFELEEELR